MWDRKSRRHVRNVSHRGSKQQ